MTNQALALKIFYLYRCSRNWLPCSRPWNSDIATARSSSRITTTSRRTSIWALNLVLILVCCCFMLLSKLKNKSADSVIGDIFQLYTEKTIKQSKRTKPYSRQIMIFCMTLAGYSSRAYSFLRDVVNKCLPSHRTLKKLLEMCGWIPRLLPCECSNGKLLSWRRHHSSY